MPEKKSQKTVTKKRNDIFFRPRSKELREAIERDAEKNYGGNISLTLNKRLGTIYNIKV